MIQIQTEAQGKKKNAVDVRRGKIWLYCLIQDLCELDLQEKN